MTNGTTTKIKRRWASADEYHKWCRDHNVWGDAANDLKDKLDKQKKSIGEPKIQETENNG